MNEPRVNCTKFNEAGTKERIFYNSTYIPGEVRFIETESEMAARTKAFCLTGRVLYALDFGDVFKVGGGDGCTIMLLINVFPARAHFKMVNFMLRLTSVKTTQDNWVS